MSRPGPDRRVPLAIAMLAMVFACLGTASVAGPSHIAPIATALR